jgi:hypothetical protein
VFGHKHARETHRQQFMNELGVGVGALRRAASHFALGTAERLSPTYDRARVVAGRGWDSTRETLTPLYQQISRNAATSRATMAAQAAKARMSRQQKNRPGGKMRGFAGLLAAGAAVGAAGAVVARRRRAQQAEWEEYDPMTGETRYYGGSRYGDESQYGHRSAKERVASGAANMADTLSSRAGRIADTLHERSSAMQERGQPGAHPGAEGQRMTGQMTGPSGTGPGMSMPGGGPGGQRNDQLGQPPLGFPDEP